MAHFTIFLLVLVLFHSVHSLCNRQNPVVTIPDGSIQGASYTTSNNVTYYGFRGIPYAKPPVGDLRLEAPEPVEPWEGTLNATEDGASCISAAGRSSEGESEDCLFVNVYVPALKTDENFAVMVWIHGGGFREGSSSKDGADPDYLIEEGVIVASLNYRLGPFGFLATGDSFFPGNYGLKDQSMALTWIQNNIEYFGGDPDKVVIFGQSAGGQSVGFQLVSPLSAGLFSGGIMQSGSGLMHFIERYPQDTAYAVANKIDGFDGEEDSQKLKDFFKSSSVEEILNATLSLEGGVQVWPCLEPESDTAFMYESPYEQLKAGNFNLVPVMAGTAAEESAGFLGTLENTMELAAQADSAAEYVVPYDLFASDEEAAAESIRNIYLAENETFSTNLLAYAHYFSDRNFSTGILEHAELASAFVPVYLFQFSYTGGRSYSESEIEGIEHASHGAELPYLFKMTSEPTTDDDNDEAADLLVQNRMVKMWTNFAKYLNPTPEVSELFENVTWPMLSLDNHPYVNINASLELGENFRQDRVTKWVDVYETYGAKPIITL